MDKTEAADKTKAADTAKSNPRKRERPVATAMDESVIKRNQALYNKHANVDGRQRSEVCILARRWTGSCCVSAAWRSTEQGTTAAMPWPRYAVKNFEGRARDVTAAGGARCSSKGRAHVHSCTRPHGGVIDTAQQYLQKEDTVLAVTRVMVKCFCLVGPRTPIRTTQPLRS